MMSLRAALTINVILGILAAPISTAARIHGRHRLPRARRTFSKLLRPALSRAAKIPVLCCAASQDIKTWTTRQMRHDGVFHQSFTALEATLRAAALHRAARSVHRVTWFKMDRVRRLEVAIVRRADLNLCHRMIVRWAPVLFGLTVGVLAFIGGSLAAKAQTAERVYRLGFLGQTSAADLTRQTAALRQGLRDLGYEESRNLIIEYRWAERKLDRLPALATELVGLKVDAIVTHGSAGSRAAKQASSTIPVVIAVVGDPVASGVVVSLSRPGGNITGLVLEEFESTVKWLELLKRVAPRASNVGWLDVPGIERPDVAEVWRQKEDDAARPLGLTIRRVPVRGMNDLAQAFVTLEQQGVHAVIVPNTSLLNPLGAQIASLAVKHRLPSVGSPIFARAGGLIAYGPDGADMYRRAAGYVDRILKGAQPASLPMEGPAKFEMIVNLKTAKALGLTISSELLGQAHQIIE